MSDMRSASSMTTTSTSSRFHVAMADQVREAAGAGDEHVHPSREGALLGLIADAAVDGDSAAATGAGDRSELALDLVRELTGGCEHQAARAARLRALDVDQQRQAEGERLAGAGGRAGADIAAGEHVRMWRSAPRTV